MSVQTVLFPKPMPPSKPPITSGKGRKYLGFPCDIAQELPIDERVEHIKNCEECKRLERELDAKVGVTEHIYS